MARPSALQKERPMVDSWGRQMEDHSDNLLASGRAKPTGRRTECHWAALWGRARAYQKAHSMGTLTACPMAHSMARPSALQKERQMVDSWGRRMETLSAIQWGRTKGRRSAQMLALPWEEPEGHPKGLRSERWG